MRNQQQEQWEIFKKEILDKIKTIDKETEWKGREPYWWIEMMEVKRTLLNN